jgi:hypothetical protein
MTYSRRQLEAFGEPLGEDVTRLKPGGRIYGGGGQPTQQVVTSTDVPDYIKPYVERMVGQTEALTDINKNPYQRYKGERVAGFTPLQRQAFEGVANLKPAEQLGVATQMGGLAGLQGMMAGSQYAQQATDPRAMQAYMSPYIQNALDPQMREAARRSAMEGQMQQAQSIQRGAFGGSRSALMEAERQRNLGQLQSDIYGRGMQTAFEQAQRAQQFGADLGLRGAGIGLQGASTLGQLGQTQFGQEKDIIQGQLSAGEQQRQLEQQRLQNFYQDFLEERRYPYEQLAFRSDMIRGLPLSQQTQTMYAGPVTPGQAVTAGVMGYGAGKQMGIFAAGGSVDDYAGGGLGAIALENLG